MANSKVIQEVLENLCVAYPNVKLDPKSPDVYERFLANFDDDLLRQAVAEHVLNSKWYPSIAEIAERVSKLENNKPTPPAVSSARIYAMEDQAAGGNYSAEDWETLAAQYEDSGRPNMAQAVRRRMGYYGGQE